MKTQHIHWISSLSIIFLLIGCQPPKDREAPVFTSANSVSMKENQTYVIALKATDMSIVTYSLGDISLATFDVNANSGVLRFKIAPDFETHEHYSVLVNATDTSGNKAGQTLKIQILDVDESIPNESKLINFNNALWVTNGQASGTKMLRDKKEDGFNLGVGKLKAFELDNMNYFSAADNTHGYELWKSDGTPEGTAMVKNISSDKNSSNPEDFVELNDMIYFSVYVAKVPKTKFDPKVEKELWRSDGSASGTQIVSGMAHFFANNGPFGNKGSRRLVKSNNRLFFANNTPPSNNPVSYGSGLNIELWTSGGTTGAMVEDLNDPLVPDFNKGSKPNSFAVLNDSVYFQALVNENAPSAPNKLVSSFCSSEGTSVYVHKQMRATNIFSTGSMLYMSGGVAGDGKGNELWQSRGNPDDAKIVKDINPGGANSDPSGFIYINGLLYFVAFEKTHGHEVWRSDGTSEGTFMLKDMLPSNKRRPYKARTLYAVNGKLFVSVNKELWVSDGSVLGTKKIESLPTMDSLFTVHGELNGQLLFSGRVITHTEATTQLWETDGTSKGSKMIHKVNSYK